MLKEGWVSKWMWADEGEGDCKVRMGMEDEEIERWQVCHRKQYERLLHQWSGTDYRRWS